MDIKTAISKATERLAKEPIGPPRMAAETLMMFALGCDRAHLYAHPKRELNPQEQSKYEDAVALRAGGKPLQYITGVQEFWGLEFSVSPAVLIPRPETEHLVSAALEKVALMNRDDVRIIDVGTGSGCVALALASELPEANLEACDISAAALEVARKNGVKLGFADRVKFYESDLLCAAEGEFDIIVSNPPYVASQEFAGLMPEVAGFEPRLALDGGVDGLDAYRALAGASHKLVTPGGRFVIEVGAGQALEVASLFAEAGWRAQRTWKDLGGIERVVSVEH